MPFSEESVTLDILKIAEVNSCLRFHFQCQEIFTKILDWVLVFEQVSIVFGILAGKIEERVAFV